MFRLRPFDGPDFGFDGSPAGPGGGSDSGGGSDNSW
jgi:hypothetical protein